MAAVKTLEEYGDWLEKDLRPRSNGDFRLGEEKFKARLRYSLGSNLTKEEILQRAEAELKVTQDALYATALPLYAEFFPAPHPARAAVGVNALPKSALVEIEAIAARR